VVLETNPDLAHVYLGYALDAINEQLSKAEEPERQAMLAALRDLQVFQRERLRTP
jgi:hypothetical protein